MNFISTPNEPYFSYDLDFSTSSPPADCHQDISSLLFQNSTPPPPDYGPPTKRPKPCSLNGSYATTPLTIQSASTNRPRMRNFQCSHPGCGKSFADNAHLRDHMFVHTGEKNLRCPDCDKCFARVASLRSHRRVHTGERPFVCIEDGCGKRYASRAALRMHVSLHAKSLPPPPGKSSPVKKKQKKSTKLAKPLCSHDDKDCHRGRCKRLSEKIKEQRLVILELQAQLASSNATSANQHASPEKTSKKSSSPKKKVKRKKTGSVVPMVAPLYLLQDGIKPFRCMLGCGRTFSNYFQLAFHAKQHPDNDSRAVLGDQLPFPVGPKYCPVEGCEFSEKGGKSMKTLQIVKRHWQRVHQNDRPFLCPDCPPTHAPKSFKTKDNLTAHRKECKKRSHFEMMLTPPSHVLVATT